MREGKEPADLDVIYQVTGNAASGLKRNNQLGDIQILHTV